MKEKTGENYLESIGRLFRYYKGLGEKAMAQMTDEQFGLQPDEVSNSVAIIVKHISGNMLSRWTDFLTSDGEKTWRKRDEEFEYTLDTREKVMNAWEEGWTCLFNAIDPLSGEDLQRIIYIRNEGHTVMEAINRQLAHYAYHVGQIVFVARHFTGEKWTSLSIPKGASKEYNKEKFDRDKDRRHFV